MKRNEELMSVSDRTRRYLPTFIAATLLTSASAAGQSVAKREPLIVQDQGSFAVGGTVTTAPGAFDPLKPLEPAGQSFRGDHVYAFYQMPVRTPRRIVESRSVGV